MQGSQSGLVSSTLGDQVNSLTNWTKQEQSQCDCVRFNYSEVGCVLLEMSCTIRTAEDGVIAVRPCLEKANEIEDMHGHRLGPGIMSKR